LKGGGRSLKEKKGRGEIQGGNKTILRERGFCARGMEKVYPKKENKTTALREKRGEYLLLLRKGRSIEPKKERGTHSAHWKKKDPPHTEIERLTDHRGQKKKKWQNMFKKRFPGEFRRPGFTNKKGRIRGPCNPPGCRKGRGPLLEKERVVLPGVRRCSKIV